MENCTVCPLVKYWYVILALIVVVWAVYKFAQDRNAPPPRAIAGVADLSAVDFEAAVGTGITLVDFWAPWCGPCKMQLPIIAETVGALPPGVKIAKVNVDAAPDLAAKFRVQSVPTWVIFKDGREVGRASGVQSKSELLNLAATK